MSKSHGYAVDDLRVFCEVARLGSFTSAAAAVHYTQPAVSRRVASLERATGGPLFVRQPRGVRLTPAGSVLHRHALDILGRLDAAVAEVAAVRRGSGGRLRIGSFATANTALLPAALARFRRGWPAVETTVVEALTAELVTLLRTGSLDVAVVSDYPTGAVPDDGLDLVPLCDDPLLVALPRDHRLAGARSIDLRDLVDECWFEAGLHGDATVLAAASARAGFVPRTDINVRSWTAKQGFVAAGLGVTLVPGLAAGGMRADIVLRPVDDDQAVRHVFAARPAAPDGLAAAAQLTALLADVAAASGAARR